MGGCGDALDPAWFVNNLRAVAARVEVQGDPEQARPLPEQTIAVTQHVIARGPKPSISWSFRACVPEFTVFALPGCELGNTILPCFGCELRSALAPIDPVSILTVPSTPLLFGQNEVILKGAICRGQVVEQSILDAWIDLEVENINPCANPEDEGRLIVVGISVRQVDDSVNMNPVINAVTFNGTDDAWLLLSEDAPTVGCRSACVEANTCYLGGGRRD